MRALGCQAPPETLLRSMFRACDVDAEGDVFLKEGLLFLEKDGFRPVEAVNPFVM